MSVSFSFRFLPKIASLRFATTATQHDTSVIVRTVMSFFGIIKVGEAHCDDDLDNSSMEHSTCNFEVEEGEGGYLSEDDFEVYKDKDDDQLANYGPEDTNRQCSIAVSKLQIRLNDLINRHKAPLLLYGEIIHLLNGYIRHGSRSFRRGSP